MVYMYSIRLFACVDIIRRVVRLLSSGNEGLKAASVDALNRITVSVPSAAECLLIAITGHGYRYGEGTAGESGLRKEDVLTRKECALAATRMLRKLGEGQGKEVEKVRTVVWTDLLIALLEMYSDSRTQPYADQVVASVRDLLGGKVFVPLFVEALWRCSSFGSYDRFHWSLWRQIRQTIVDAEDAYFGAQPSKGNGRADSNLRVDFLDEGLDRNVTRVLNQGKRSNNNTMLSARENLIRILKVVETKLMQHQAIRRNIFEVILSRILDDINVELEVVDEAVRALSAHYNDSVHYMITGHRFAKSILRSNLSLSLTTPAEAKLENDSPKPLTPSSQPSSPMAHAGESMMSAQLSTLKRRVSSARLSGSHKSAPSSQKSTIESRRRHKVQSTGRSIALAVNHDRTVRTPDSHQSGDSGNANTSIAISATLSEGSSKTYMTSAEFKGMLVEDPAAFAAEATSKLRDKSDWNVQFEGLTMVRRLALNHAQEVSTGQWTEVVKLVIRFFESLRSSLCKQSLLCMDDLINSLPKRCLDTQLERVIPALLKKSADTSAFVVDAAAKALNSAIARLSQTKICAILLGVGASHSNSNIRAKAAQFLLVLVCNGKEFQDAEELEEQVKSVVTHKLLHDNASATRTAAKRILQALSARGAERPQVATSPSSGLHRTNPRKHRLRRKSSSSQSLRSKSQGGGNEEERESRPRLATSDIESLREWVVALDSHDWRVRKDALSRLAELMDEKRECEWGRERTIVLDAFAERVNDSNLKVKAAALEHLLVVLKGVAVMLDAPILLILLEALLHVSVYGIQSTTAHSAAYRALQVQIDLSTSAL